jgi:GH24 family phage-related lysozyme (muramidase)
LPVLQRVDRSKIERLVYVNTAHTEYRRTAKTWSIGSREYGYIATYEDLTLTMYDADGDPDGNTTIGFGHLIHHEKIGNTEANKLLEEPFKNGITESQAVDFLIENVQEKEGFVNKYIAKAGIEDNITGQQYTALVDIAMNMGQTNAKKIVKILKESGAIAAAEKIRSWKPKKGGLGNRREFEARLMEGNGLISKIDLEKEKYKSRKKLLPLKNWKRRKRAQIRKNENHSNCFFINSWIFL